MRIHLRAHIEAAGAALARIDDQHPVHRAEILAEFQRYAAQTMYMFYGAGSSPGYQLAQPWLGNFGVYRTHTIGSAGNEIYTHLWIDNSKKS